MDDLKTNREVGGVKYRKLRIAWSVAWGIACLLLIALWVRGCAQFDELAWGILNGPGGKFISRQGELAVTYYPTMDGWVSAGLHLAAGSFGAWEPLSTEVAPAYHRLGFATKIKPGQEYCLVTPTWLLVFLAGGVAVVPWLPWRFSLRTLLIAITVAAVGLGWIVYGFRN